MVKSSGQFRFAKHDSIGANAAEEDEVFLADCFVDTGDLNILLDFKNPKCIACGRTGSGKSALLETIKRQKTHQIIDVRPESLSFNYIANSTIIRFFIDLGVNLDPFFKLLWRHIIAVEIIRHKFRLKTPEAKRNWLQSFFARQQDRAHAQRQKRHERAIKYLERFGDKFWEETEYRSKDMATKFENELHNTTTIEGKAGVPIVPVNISVDVEHNRQVIKSLSCEERATWVNRGQSVINSVQVQELEDIFSLIDELLDDGCEQYVILIDRLDDSWVDDSIRFRLIRALIDTAREFRKVENVKIIIALRQDLLERVFKNTRPEDAGFQEEKFKSLILPVTWSRAQLIDMLDRRIAKLVKDRYTKAVVTHADIMSAKQMGFKGNRQDPIDYLLTRTWMRPRDAIEFINICLHQATGKSSLTGAMLTVAESEYSRSRFQSLGDEWNALYPGLLEFLAIYKKKPKEFRLSDITNPDVESFCLDFVIENEHAKGRLAELAKAIVDQTDTHAHFRSSVAFIFYLVGACGLKSESHTQFVWHAGGSTSLSPAEISDESRITVHPALWRHLGIDQR
jgi:energy-coupling factor transporter ATP-binding protein EcfA2